MNFFAYTLFFASLSYSTSMPKPNPEQQCVPGQSMNVMLGTSAEFFEKDLKPSMPKDQQPKVCGEGTIRCGSDGKYSKCINDSWVEKRCSCPGLTCGSGFQTHTCGGKVRS